jgi:hypothetical protein
MQKFNFVSVDNILSKYQRDFRGLGLHETDAIEWIGEALGFMKLPSASVENIAFLEVKNYEAALPYGLHYIIQVARNTEYEPENAAECALGVAKELIPTEIEDITCSGGCPENNCSCGSSMPLDSNGVPLFDYDENVPDYSISFNLQAEYYGWRHSEYYAEKWQPVVLANHSFFNALVCQDPNDADIYRNKKNYPEYTIIENSLLRFSFKEGYVAVAYIGQKVDNFTGYPMIPDDEYARNAITYYLAWKIKQREAYMHKEGALALAREAQAQWNDYILKFKNKAKMPTGVDQYQNLAQQSRYLIPRHNRYYGFFGNLSKMEDRRFAHPERIYENSYIANRRKYIPSIQPDSQTDDKDQSIFNDDYWDSAEW